MFTIRPLTRDDLPALVQFWQEHWGGEFIVVHDTIYSPDQLDGFVAEEDGTWQGVITFIQQSESIEIVSLDSLVQGQGIGSALIQRVVGVAREAGVLRIWLMTTNDNLAALRFYQKRGFRMVAVHRGAVDRARRFKPSIPIKGIDGIPLHDEIELEMQV